jgi:ferric-dicitrate binding protein FerR (iron transport regulator)
MAKSFHHGNEWSEVESLIRSAGNYVRPSEELRPRVLEAARSDSGERKARRHLWLLAIAVGLLGTLVAVVSSRSPASFSHGMLSATATSTDVRPAEGGAAGWSIVDAYTELRRRQAALLCLDWQSK